MSTSAVTSTSPTQLQQYFQTRQGDLRQLGQALSSGDLAGAQTAYNKIVSLGQNGPFTGGNPFVIKQREQDFTNIGQALQSGDLAGAQQAFSTLAATFTGGNRRLDPPPTSPSAASASGPEIILNISPSSSGSSASPEQITLNISNSASGGEQISLSVGNQGSNNAEQVTFNLPSNSNEQIVLNLLGTPAASSGSSSTSAASSAPASGGLSVTA